MKKTTNIRKECIYCKFNGKDPTKKKDKLIMIGLDRPYINVWFHKSCFDEIGWEKMGSFLQDSKEIWYND